MATIVFDFDGTIADTFPVVLDIFHKVSRQKRPLTETEAGIVRRVALRQVKGRTAIIHHANQIHIAWWRVPFLFFACQLLLKTRMRDVQIFPGLHKVITELHKEGHILLVVSSNTTRNIDIFLKKEHLRAYFSTVYGGVRSGKKPEALRLLKERGKLTGENSWLIGDEERDIAAAHAAKLKSIAVTWGYNDVQQLKAGKPLKMVQTPEEITEIITE